VSIIHRANTRRLLDISKRAKLKRVLTKEMKKVMKMGRIFPLRLSMEKCIIQVFHSHFPIPSLLLILRDSLTKAQQRLWFLLMLPILIFSLCPVFRIIHPIQSHSIQPHNHNHNYTFQLPQSTKSRFHPQQKIKTILRSTSSRS